MYQELLTIKGNSYSLAKEDITCISDNWALPLLARAFYSCPLW